MMQTEPNEYQIALRPSDLALIGALLNARPHGEVRGLIDRIQAQVDAQQFVFISQQFQKGDSDGSH